MDTPRGNLGAVLRHYYKNGEKQRAFKIATDELRRNEDHGEMHEVLGLLHYLELHIDQAIHHLETACTLLPLNSRSQIALANCYIERDFGKAASAIFEHLVTLPDLPSDLFPDLAKGFARLGDYHNARQACEAAIERMPDCEKAWFGLVFYMTRCSYPCSKVISVMRKVVSLAPKSIDYRMVIANLCDQIGYTAEAEDHLLAIDPNDILNQGSGCCIRRLKDLAQRLQVATVVEFCDIRLTKLRE